MHVEYADSLADVTGEDVLDSRDLERLIDRLDELDERDEDQQTLLDALKELRDDCDGSGWVHGIAFISEIHWQDYCREMANDIGYVQRDDNNPLMSCIDWEKWADLVSQDYSTSEIDDHTYYWREA